MNTTTYPPFSRKQESPYYSGHALTVYNIRRMEHYSRLIHDCARVKRHVQIIDVGGYTGELYEYIKKTHADLHKKITCTIIDYDRAALAAAKKRGITTIYADLNTFG